MTAIRFRGVTEGIWRKKNRNRVADAKENTLRGLLGWGDFLFCCAHKRDVWDPKDSELHVFRTCPIRAA